MRSFLDSLATNILQFFGNVPEIVAQAMHIKVKHQGKQRTATLQNVRSTTFIFFLQGSIHSGTLRNKIQVENGTVFACGS